MARRQAEKAVLVAGMVGPGCNLQASHLDSVGKRQMSEQRSPQNVCDSVGIRAASPNPLGASRLEVCRPSQAMMMARCFETRRLDNSTALGFSFNEDGSYSGRAYRKDGPVARPLHLWYTSRRPHGEAARSSKRTRIVLEEDDVSPDDVPSSLSDLV
jgi:hypothetical protein